MTARVVIERLGGTRSVARALHLTASTVHSWVRRNSIPEPWHDALLVLARRFGKQLERADLVDSPAPKAA